MKKLLPFWNKDKRRLDKELLDQDFHIRLGKSEIDYIKKQAEENCCSTNSIVRKLIKKDMKTAKDFTGID